MGHSRSLSSSGGILIELARNISGSDDITPQMLQPQQVTFSASNDLSSPQIRNLTSVTPNQMLGDGNVILNIPRADSGIETLDYEVNSVFEEHPVTHSTVYSGHQITGMLAKCQQRRPRYKRPAKRETNVFPMKLTDSKQVNKL